MTPNEYAIESIDLNDISRIHLLWALAESLPANSRSTIFWAIDSLLKEQSEDDLFYANVDLLFDTVENGGFMDVQEAIVLLMRVTTHPEITRFKKHASEDWRQEAYDYVINLFRST